MAALEPVKTAVYSLVATSLITCVLAVSSFIGGARRERNINSGVTSEENSIRVDFTPNNPEVNSVLNAMTAVVAPVQIVGVDTTTTNNNPIQVKQKFNHAKNFSKSEEGVNPLRPEDLREFAANLKKKLDHQLPSTVEGVPLFKNLVDKNTLNPGKTIVTGVHITANSSFEGNANLGARSVDREHQDQDNQNLALARAEAIKKIVIAELGGRGIEIDSNNIWITSAEDKLSEEEYKNLTEIANRLYPNSRNVQANLFKLIQAHNNRTDLPGLTSDDKNTLSRFLDERRSGSCEIQLETTTESGTAYPILIIPIPIFKRRRRTAETKKAEQKTVEPVLAGFMTAARGLCSEIKKLFHTLTAKISTGIHSAKTYLARILAETRTFLKRLYPAKAQRLSIEDPALRYKVDLDLLLNAGRSRVPYENFLAAVKTTQLELKGYFGHPSRWKRNYESYIEARGRAINELAKNLSEAWDTHDQVRSRASDPNQQKFAQAHIVRLWDLVDKFPKCNERTYLDCLRKIVRQDMYGVKPVGRADWAKLAEDAIKPGSALIWQVDNAHARGRSTNHNLRRQTSIIIDNVLKKGPTIEEINTIYGDLIETYKLDNSKGRLKNLEDAIVRRWSSVDNSNYATDPHQAIMGREYAWVIAAVADTQIYANKQFVIGGTRRFGTHNVLREIERSGYLEPAKLVKSIDPRDPQYLWLARRSVGRSWRFSQNRKIKLLK